MDPNTPQKPEITPEKLSLNRRKFMKLAALFGTAYALAACGIDKNEIPNPSAPDSPTASPLPTAAEDKPTAYDKISEFTNFYEFSVDKYQPAKLAQNFKSSPWAIEMGGLVENPGTIEAQDLIKEYGGEERIYRFRCVEGWSMVIPWLGFSLNRLLSDLKPKPEARYVKFTTLYDPDQLPGQKDLTGFTWPYVEGLRLDEAQNELALLAWGIYGKELPPQNGAPLRLVIPWKYGFKSIKSIVTIELVAEQPATFWNTAAPQEYGFYANVNPNVDHPRWSQANETRVGENGTRPTLMFNGYEKEVAHLYEGMDLTRDY
ncbi:MAG TPA: protein-methionine-sulfoxide reductase catalytic subunit MsrP [Anaerolineaceae bacterium]|nr:protein-methionine-sulfoxide reductase catalytic subunit MsrP [Anaerolineaceae bacterium]